MIFKVVDFSMDIIDSALESITERCIMVFPTRAVAELARLRFEPRWALQDVRWLAMEDFKTILLAEEKALLEDEKRLLALYQVLQEKDKERFHIRSYGDLVNWGTNFFRFMQEFNEANKGVDDLLSLSEDQSLFMRAWQEVHIEHIHAISSRYKEFIEERGFSDRIFRLPLNEVNIPWRDQRIVLVNQFYYSKLEQELLCRCEEAHNEVILYYHGARVDGDNWQMPVFQPEKSAALKGLEDRLRIVECESEEQAALAFLAANEAREDAVIIDANFRTKAYSALFDESIVAPASTLPITNSLLFRFFSMLNEIVQSQTHSPDFVPLRIMTYYLCDPAIPPLLEPDWDNARQQRLEREIFALADEEVLYLDINPRAQFECDPMYYEKYRLLAQICSKTFAYAREILNLNSIKELSELCADSLDPRQFCSPEELGKTDILEQYWTALANFMGAETLGIVEDWRLIFEHPGAGIFGLWLDYLKPALLHYQASKRSQPGWEVSNLLDCRNRSFRHVAFLQLVEGILPQAPGAVWLLNEGQRARLGLLSYEVIRNWEHYYFFRLLLTAQSVQIYTYRNMEQNQKPSSFIGELLQWCPASVQKRKIPTPAIFRAYKKASRKALASSIGENAIFQHRTDADFCVLPVDPQKDFGPEREIRFYSYDIALLARNPFVWYIQALRRLRPRKTELKESVSPILFGTLMHSYFSDILGKDPVRYSSASELKEAFTNTDKLKVALQSLSNSSEFYYKIPKNYNEEFLNSIISECLANSLKEFYFRFLLPRLNHTGFELIPEGARPEDEKTFKELCRVEHEGKHYTLKIKGRADLRIHSPQKRFIVDFKTGSANAAQLLFYEWFYELIEHPERAEQMSSSFWMILDMQVNAKETVNEKKRLSFPADTRDLLLECFARGYGTGKKSGDRHLLKSISRSDLIIEREEN
ncbi:MAG: PD-(D/E)XK nuclease family protein [Candidatus Cloacimonetes bacterium]|nr:PD-(D/E)XK nuclease family protein [Candidatus Cloacimonadota bacterium]MDD4099528.1 PD-(D/E)XK nuclease family protein [Candidatus Cloacimonadota bacterium]MDD4805891.1 PD-(D/E)XK nuclease family protein [Candidatus Cloacimonadota bacterium]